MHSHYYIELHHGKDGPHDLITLMRRIRSDKILPETRIYVGDDPTPHIAFDIDELRPFFLHVDHSLYGHSNKPQTFRAMLTEGWQFTMQHSIMAVCAGGLLLLSLLLALLFISLFGLAYGCIIGWVGFMLLHNIYIIFCLRLYRGQTLGADFFQQQFMPIVGRLIAASILIAVMMAGGFVLFIAPCIIVMMLYSFVPFLFIDRRYSIIEAMHQSRLSLHTRSRSYVGHVGFLMLLQLICLVLIIPLPLALPIFSAALCAIYEDVTSA